MPTSRSSGSRPPPIARRTEAPLAILVDDGKVANRGFVIDREGIIRTKFVGSTPDKFERLQQAVDAVL